MASALELVWVSSVARARSIGRPELIIVENCREKIARSFSLTFVRTLNSIFRPTFF